MSNIILFNRQLSPEDLAQVPANSTSNILNRLMVSYDPRIRPNFQGNVPVYTTTMQNYTCVFIKSKHISQNTCSLHSWILFKDRLWFKYVEMVMTLTFLTYNTCIIHSINLFNILLQMCMVTLVKSYQSHLLMIAPLLIVAPAISAMVLVPWTAGSKALLQIKNNTQSIIFTVSQKITK